MNINKAYPVAAFFSLCLLMYPEANANLREDVFGSDSRVQALGGAGVTSSRRASSIYYNPANLSFNTQNSLEIGYQHIDYKLKVSPLPEGISTDTTAPRDSLSLGLTMQLPFNFAFGALLNFGLDRIQYFDQSSPDTKPRFVKYGQNIEQLSLLLGLAFQPLEDLSIGFSIAPLVNSTLNIGADIPIQTTGREVANRYSWDLEPNMTYYAGINYRPVSNLSVGLVYRSEMFHKLEASADITVDVVSISAPMRIILESFSWYSPQQLAAGFTYNWEKILNLSFDLTWYQWSVFPGPYIHTTPGADSALAGSLNYSEQPKLDFKDSFVPRVGLEAPLYDFLTLRTGYSFQSAVLGPPTGDTNLLDSDSHQISGGLGIRFDIDKSNEPVVIEIDLQGSVKLLAPLAVTKGEDIEILREYTFKGLVYDASVMVSAWF